ARDQRVGVHLNHVLAVFQRISDAHPFMRQLALLAGRDETGRHPAAHPATAPPRIKPRASMPATLSIFMPAQGCTNSSTARRNARASPSSVVMSRNMMPGLG